MSDSTRTNNESDLTAWVLGELPPAEREAFERLLASDPALQREADVLRDVASLVFLALQAETSTQLSAAQRERVRAAATALKMPPVVARPNRSRRRMASRGMVILASLAMVAAGLLFVTVAPRSTSEADEPVASYTFWKLAPLQTDTYALAQSDVQAEQLQVAFQLEGSVPTDWITFDKRRGLNYVDVPLERGTERLYVTSNADTQFVSTAASSESELLQEYDLPLTDESAPAASSPADPAVLGALRQESVNGPDFETQAVTTGPQSGSESLEQQTAEDRPVADFGASEVDAKDRYAVEESLEGRPAESQRGDRSRQLESARDTTVLDLQPGDWTDDGVVAEQSARKQLPDSPYASTRRRSASEADARGFGYNYFDSLAASNAPAPTAESLNRSGGFPIDADGDGTIDLSNGTLLYRQYFESAGAVPAEAVQGLMSGAAVESAEREYRVMQRKLDASSLAGPAVPSPDASGSLRFVVPPQTTFAEGEGTELREEPVLSRMDDLLTDRETGLGMATEWYAPLYENTFVSPLDAPLSTFSTDVDTAAFTNVRRFIDAGLWPPADAVRIEELINYFDYSLLPPAGEHPIAVAAEAAACPWQPDHRLARVTLQARDIDAQRRPPTTLVFLTDVSGSMRDDNKLPLVQQSLKLLTERLTENDRVALVTYADEANLQLDSTPGDRHDLIHAAIDALQADGSTNGAGGLTLAYDVARRHFVDHGTNRVILCSDGDFNVGISDDDQLVQLIEEQRRSGVFLSVFGFGTGNLKDAKLEALADHGNGQYGYVDSLDEARRVFVEQITGTLYTVAKDVKLQVDFNPLKVAAYRLIGYENRALESADFDADAVDAGDLGAGQSATALYELTLRSVSDEQEAAVLGRCLEQRSTRFGLAPEQQVAVRRSRQKLTIEGQVITELSKEDVGRAVEALYGVPQQQNRLHVENRISVADDAQPLELGVPLDDLLTVRVRYKRPAADESRLLEVPLVDAGHQQVPSDDFAWSSAVASFGLLLRQSPYSGLATFDSVIETASAARGEDPTGRRREFIDMVRRARAIWESAHGSASPAPIELTSTVAREKATSGGVYDVLLDKLNAPEDLAAYGSFHEYGWWSGAEYRGHTGLPAGYWVYVYPDWYIWQQRRTP